MKDNRASQIFAGIFFFILAVFFSFCLLFTLFDSGAMTSGFYGAMLWIGHLIVNSYGICSILIPFFLFAVSVVFLILQITFKSCIYISFSLLPFFTAVASEKIYKASSHNMTGPFQIVKFILTIIATLLIMAIELLLSGIIAERLAFAHRQRKQFLRKAELEDELLFGEEQSSQPEFTGDKIIPASGTGFKTLKTYDSEYLHAFDQVPLYTDSPLESEQVESDAAPNFEPEITEQEIKTLQEDFAEQPYTTEPTTLTKQETFIDPIHETEPATATQPDITTELPQEIDINSDTELNDDYYSDQEFEDPQETQPDNFENPQEFSNPQDFPNPENFEIPTELDNDHLSASNTVPAANFNEPQDDFEIYDPSFEQQNNESQIAKKEKIYDSLFQANLDNSDGVADIFSQMDREIREEVECQDNIQSPDEFDDFEISYSDDDDDNLNDDSDENSDFEDPDTQLEKELSLRAEYANEAAEEESQESDDDFIEPEFEESENEENLTEKNLNQQVQLNQNTNFEPVQIQPTSKTVKEAEAEIRQERKSTVQKRSGPYKVPTEQLLNEFEDQKYWVIDAKTNEAATLLKATLEEFKIAAEVTGIRKGPVVTMFEILPAPGVKLSKIVALQDNIALRLAASSVRIVAPIPGKRAVGIEVPNENRATVTFRELIEQNLPEYKKMAVPVVLGKDIQGEAQLLDIAKTPHLLIAGSTGSGKSVCVNSIILSILFKRSPNEVKLILIDPKIVELKLYNDIPHLLTPVITEPKKALQSLQYCLCEMERRYALLDGLGVRDIINYNKRIEERHIATEKLPYIVVIIDEFADLMATTGKELESTIARLCAMSRAVGIHLVLATQRPSIDVITGLIKANIPTRIAFMVASKMDSRIIIDQVGAEKLLGRGDMLYASATDPFPVRIQGTYVSDDEVENVVDYVKGFGEPEYIDDEIFVDDEDDELSEPNLFSDGDDPLYNKALEIVVEAGKASASYLQRRLKIGYNRAARLVEDMESRGIVGPANGSKPREIIHLP